MAQRLDAQSPIPNPIRVNSRISWLSLSKPSFRVFCVFRGGWNGMKSMIAYFVVAPPLHPKKTLPLPILFDINWTVSCFFSFARTRYLARLSTHCG